MGWCLSVKQGKKIPYTKKQYSVILFLYILESVVVIIIITITSFCLELVKIKPHNTAALNGPGIQVSILSICRMVTCRGKPKYLDGNLEW
jgi:hypothetical protein